MTEAPQEIFKHWVHSHEEDAEDVRVYRPKGYDFPPARGRTGFELTKDGQLTYYGIAAAEGSRRMAGRWTFEGSRLTLYFEDEHMTPLELDIVACDASTLRVRKSRS